MVWRSDAFFHTSLDDEEFGIEIEGARAPMRSAFCSFMTSFW